MKKLLWALLLLLPAAASQAQYESFGENKIVYDNFDWKTYRSTHFTIYFYEREKPAIQKVTSYAESAYDDISRRLNFQIPKPINLIYYATHSDFEQTNTLLNFIPEGVGAFALPSRNRMVLPVDLPDEELQHLIAHELTHVFQFEILFGGNYLRAATTSAPQWFLEGMASYYGNDEENKDRMVLRDLVLSDQVPEIAQKGDTQGYIAYRFGHAVFDFIAAEWGKDAVRDFLFEFRNQVGGKLDKVIKRTFNITAEDFDIKFRRYLRQRYLKILTEKGEPVDFGERFKVDDTPSAELSPRAYPSGDFVAAISTYKDQADVVLMSTRDRKLFKNLTRGYTTKYEYVVAQLVTTGPQSGADIGVAPDGNTVAVFARRERGRDLLLLNALTGGIRERVEMPGLDQQLNPAFAPDGKTVVFRALKSGRSDLYAYHLDSRTITNLTDDDAYDFGPSFSPDGKWIYYSSVRGTKSKIFRFRPETPESREQITYGDWHDEDPALSPDGKRLFFTSDRDGGIYNIYSLNLETGETFLHTNVVAGAFSPTVFIGKDNTEKLVFAAYYKRRFTLYIADAKKPIQKLADLAPAASPTGPQGYVPYQPAIEVAIDNEKVTSRPSRKLQLEDASINAGVNSDQTFVSNTVLVFGDNLGDRRFIAVLQSLSTYTNIFLQYLDLTHRLQKGIALFDDRTYYTSVNTIQTFAPVTRIRRLSRQTGGLGILSYPFSRYLRAEGQLGYISRSIAYPDRNSFNPDTGVYENFFTLKNNFPLASVALIDDTTAYREWGPLAGRKLRLAFSYAYDVDHGKYGDFSVPGTGPTLSQDFSVDLRQYIKITPRSLIAVRLFGARATGNLPNIYWFGGLDTLRGLDYATAYGNTVGYANFEYRFPLIDFLAFPFGGFRDIRGHLFFDIGGAAVQNQPFRFWDSSNHQLINGIASYGYGLQFTLFGLQLHWDFAKLTNLKHAQSGLRTSFYIGYEF